MTNYTAKGYEVLSDHAGRMIGQDRSVLEVIVPNAVGKLVAHYLSDDAQQMQVSLSDYNIKMNGTHLLDGVEPTAIELFTLRADRGAETVVLNFSYRTDKTQLDRFYAVDGAALPELCDAAGLLGYLAQISVARAAGPEISIDLAQMPDVSIRGYVAGSEGRIDAAPDMFEFAPDPGLHDDMAALEMASGLITQGETAKPEQPGGPSAAEWEDALLALSEVFTPDASGDIIPS